MITTLQHVVINTGIESSRLECLHCGAVYTPHVPCAISMYVAILTSFMESHDQCLFKKEGRVGPAPVPIEHDL